MEDMLLSVLTTRSKKQSNTKQNPGNELAQWYQESQWLSTIQCVSIKQTSF